jgi:hypothetical protein
MLLVFRLQDKRYAVNVRTGTKISEQLFKKKAGILSSPTDLDGCRHWEEMALNSFA